MAFLKTFDPTTDIELRGNLCPSTRRWAIEMRMLPKHAGMSFPGTYMGALLAKCACEEFTLELPEELVAHVKDALDEEEPTIKVPEKVRLFFHIMHSTAASYEEGYRNVREMNDPELVEIMKAFCCGDSDGPTVEGDEYETLWAVNLATNPKFAEWFTWCLVSYDDNPGIFGSPWNDSYCAFGPKFMLQWVKDNGLRFGKAWTLALLMRLQQHYGGSPYTGWPIDDAPRVTTYQLVAQLCREKYGDEWADLTLKYFGSEPQNE